MKVEFKKLVPEAKAPTYAKPGDAGLDLVATSKTQDYQIGKIIFGTGLAVHIPTGYVGLLFPRSSIIKTSLSLANSVGVIDSGYRGEIKAFFNPGNSPSKMEVGDRVAQLVIVPYLFIEPVIVDHLEETERGDGGIGSTGR